MHASKTTTFRLGGSYAVRATEDAPAFVVSSGQTVLMFAPRTFTPWNGRGSVEFALGPATTVALIADFGHTAFYTWAAAGVQVTRRFGRAAADGSGTAQ